MRGLVAYWRTQFDWRAQEARFNAFPQYTVPLHGIDLHFLHVPGKGPKPTPLLLMHGWPGSVFEFLDIIPRLTDPAAFGGDPADAFTVVAPSLPGYGLSFRPGQPRFSAAEMADCFADLMTGVLGYPRFAAQGGDWGAFIASALGVHHASKLLGIHINLLSIRPDLPPPENPTEEEARYFQEVAVWVREETGYQWIQGTRPQTLAFGLTDSPAGLAAWIVEKFRTWGDTHGDIESSFSKDDLLSNIMIYWVTGTITSSMRFYYESARARRFRGRLNFVHLLSRERRSERNSDSPNTPAGAERRIQAHAIEITDLLGRVLGRGGPHLLHHHGPPGPATQRGLEGRAVGAALGNHRIGEQLRGIDGVWVDAEKVDIGGDRVGTERTVFHVLRADADHDRVQLVVLAQRLDNAAVLVRPPVAGPGHKSRLGFLGFCRRCRRGGQAGEAGVIGGPPFRPAALQLAVEQPEGHQRVQVDQGDAAPGRRKEPGQRDPGESGRPDPPPFAARVPEAATVGQRRDPEEEADAPAGEAAALKGGVEGAAHRKDAVAAERGWHHGDRR